MALDVDNVAKTFAELRREHPDAFAMLDKNREEIVRAERDLSEAISYIRSCDLHIDEAREREVSEIRKFNAQVAPLRRVVAHIEKQIGTILMARQSPPMIVVSQDHQNV